MALIATGIGHVTKSAHAPRGGVRVVLSNFDIDGYLLKPRHLGFMDTEVMPILLGNKARIWLQGMASHSGSDTHNMELSRKRANAVATYLRSRGVHDSQVRVEAAGESMATAGATESPNDRAVSLLAAPLFQIPSPSHLVSTPIPSNTSFRIRLHAALSGGVTLVGDYLIFEIWDFTNSLTCFYHYGGGGVGVSVRWLGATLAGPWNEFTTNKPLQVVQFGRPARSTTGGALNWTINFLNMMGLPTGVATIPPSMQINTGQTLGLGGSTTVGIMKPVDTKPWPFSGP